MKKRILAGMMMMVLVLATAMSVSAAESKQEPVVEAGASDGRYDVENEDVMYAALADTTVSAEKQTANKAATEVIKKVNAGTDTTKIDKAIDKDIQGKTLVQEFFELEEVGEHDACYKQGYHTITLQVSAMTTAWKNIVVVHYSLDRSVWEVIPVETKNVDYTNKTITFTIKDLSPIAIYADIDASAAAGTAPKMGTMSSAWMLWTAAALVVLGTGVVVSQKKRG